MSGKRRFWVIFAIVFIFSLSIMGPNNTLASPGALVRVDPDISTASQGETVAIDIVIEQVTDLFAWQFNLTWNPVLLNFTDALEGDFLNEWGTRGTFFQSPHEDMYTNGYAFMGCLMTEDPTSPGFEGASGTGTLATLEFEVLALGDCTLELSGVKLLDRFGERMTFTTEDGVFINVGLPEPSFTYSPSIAIIGQNIIFNATASTDSDGYIVGYEWDFGDTTNGTGVIVEHAYPTGGLYSVTLTVTDNATLKNTKTEDLRVRYDHDVEVTSVTASATTVARGQAVVITVSITNIGVSSESSVGVTIYYDQNTAGTLTITDLDPDDTETENFSWDTTDVDEGTYSIRAEATPVAGETSTDDNDLVDGDVTITPTGEEFPLLPVIGGVVVVVVIIAAVALYMRRKS